jgi:hypothetical protein
MLMLSNSVCIVCYTKINQHQPTTGFIQFVNHVWLLIDYYSVGVSPHMGIHPNCFSKGKYPGSNVAEAYSYVLLWSVLFSGSCFFYFNFHRTCGYNISCWEWNLWCLHWYISHFIFWFGVFISSVKYINVSYLWFC